MHRFYLICWLMCLAGLTRAQTPGAPAAPAAAQLNLAQPAPKRQLQAVRLTTAAPKMDGVLD